MQQPRGSLDQPFSPIQNAKKWGKNKAEKHDSVIFAVNVEYQILKLKDSRYCLQFSLQNLRIFKFSRKIDHFPWYFDMNIPGFYPIQPAPGKLPDWDMPMLAKTHGQPASPTNLAKEFKVRLGGLGRVTLWIYVTDNPTQHGEVRKIIWTKSLTKGDFWN